MAKEARRVLHLIDQQRQRVPSQKAGRVVFGRCGFAGQVERHVMVLRKQVPAQGRFARLAGAREHQYRSGAGQLQQSGFDLARNPHGAGCRTAVACQSWRQILPMLRWDRTIGGIGG